MAFGWVAYVFYVAMFAIAVYSIMNAPKAPDATIQTGEVPTAAEGRPIPVAFGTVLVRDPNIVWYGDLATKPILSDGGKK